MRRPSALPLVVLGFAALLSAGPGLSQTTYNRTSSERVGQYKSAAASYEKALRLLEKKDRDGALDALVVSLEKMPDYPDSHFLRARIFYGEKEYTQALDEMVKAREGFASTAELRDTIQRERRNALSEQIRRKDNSIAEWTRQMSQVPPEQRQQIELTIGALQRDRDAMQQEMLEYNPRPTSVPARYSSLHGSILLRLDRNAEAIVQYEEALKVDPGYGEAANNLASLYHAAGQNEKALEIVTEAQKRGARLHPELRKSIEAALAKRP